MPPLAMVPLFLADVTYHNHLSHYNCITGAFNWNNSMLNHWSIIYTIDRNGSPIDVGFVLAYMKNASIISCGIKPYLSSSCEFFVLAIAIVYHIFNNQQEAVLCSLISYVNASYINRFYIQSTLFFLFFFFLKMNNLVMVLSLFCLFCIDLLHMEPQNEVWCI